MKVGLFIPCYINAVYPEVGIASYKLLKHVGVDVDFLAKLHHSAYRLSDRPDLLRTTHGERRLRG